MRRRMAVERRVIALLRVKEQDLAALVAKTGEFRRLNSDQYPTLLREVGEAFAAMQKLIAERKMLVLSVDAGWVSGDELLLLNWLAEAQRVAPRYAGPYDTEFGQAIRRCGALLNSMGHRLPIGVPAIGTGELVLASTQR